MDIKPVIGITTQNDNPQSLWERPYVRDYVISIERAGGQVRLLPAGGFDESLMEVFSSLDGLLLSGGGDMDPIRFNGLPHPTVEGVDLERDGMELKLVDMAVFYGLPIFGICRGIQVMNVALGGTLYTDLPDQLGTTIAHSTENELPKDTINHTVQVLPETWLSAVTRQNDLPVNSRHHQGLLTLAGNLQVMAVAPDGLVEAVNLPDHPFGVGVQWHPENLLNDPYSIKLFSLFVQAAKDLM